MQSHRFVLVGGGLAAAKAAEQLRRLDESAAIALITAENHLPYNRPPLSKEYLRGEKDRASILVAPPQIYQEQRIETRLGRTALGIDVNAKAVLLDSGESVAFDRLLIATGGRPRRLDIVGAGLAGIHYLRTLDDAEAIRRAAAAGSKAVIVGAGFIGMEVAASLTQMGVKVAVLEVAPYIWGRFLDAEMASFFQRYCEERGITFFTGESVREFRGRDRVTSVVTSAGRELPCDFACVGVGIVPNVELAQTAGLAVNNGIVVNEFLQTSHPDIYAAGDVASYYDPVFGKRRRVEHWGHAEYTGLLAAENMASETPRPYDLLTYVWSDLFDLHLEFAGDETEHDQVLLRGRFEDGSFTVLYLKDGALRAYFAVNGEQREFLPMQRLIRRHVDLSGRAAQLQDRSFNLRELLK